MSALTSLTLNGLEINDYITFSTPYFGIDDTAAADLKLQKLVYGPPVYTGKTYGEVTYTIKINVMPQPGDWTFQDFDAKVYTLKQAFDTRLADLTTLRLQRYGQPAKVVQGTAKSFVVDRTTRQVTVQYVVPDGVWKSEAQESQSFAIQTSGQQMALTSIGTSDTDPTFTIKWNTSKVAVNPQGKFFTYQIPVTITNNARASVIRHPIEITGYTPAPSFTATAGAAGSGTIPGGSLQVGVSTMRVAPNQASTETDAALQTVTIQANGSVTITFNTIPDALQYNLFAGSPCALQTTVTQPDPVLQSDGQMRVPATWSVTLTSITAGGRVAPTINTTGWDHANLVAQGLAAADGSDVRVLSGGVAVPFTMIGPNTSQARVWILLDAGVAEASIVYLQWGNRNPDPITPWPVGDKPIIDLVGSSNYHWSWNQTDGFFDYTNITRPGSWASVSSVGNGYGWKQDNNVVRRGEMTGYATPSYVLNGDFTWGGTIFWSITGTWTVDNTNPRFGSLDAFSAVTTGSSSISQTVATIPGQYYNVSAWVWSDQANGTLTVKDSNGTTLFTWTSSGSSFYEQAKTVAIGTSSLLGIPSFLVETSSVTITLTCGAGNYRLDDVALWPAANTSDKVPLVDPQGDICSVMGLLHSAPAVNNLEVPLNGWELDHPSTITKVTHWGVTAMTGSDANNDNVLRLIAMDQTRPPLVVWGQGPVSNGGPVPYATQANPMVNTLSPSREQVQFQINVSVPSDAVNGDGTFVAIEGVAVDVNPQYVVGLAFDQIQSFYDLNCTITQSTDQDGDQIMLATNLEENASLLVDCKNKMVWHVDSNGKQSLRISALTLDSLRPYWMKIHPGDNILTYTEDVVGGVSVEVDWFDAWN